MTTNQSVQTRRVYAMDLEIEYMQPERSIYELRELAWRIWPGPINRIPYIVAGDGLKSKTGRMSYALVIPNKPYSCNRIVMARHQRNDAVLCHELAHAVSGICGHGKMFLVVYESLLLSARVLPKKDLDLLTRKYKVYS